MPRLPTAPRLSVRRQFRDALLAKVVSVTVGIAGTALSAALFVEGDGRKVIDWGTVGSSAVVAAVLGPVASYFLVRRFRNEDATMLARLREDLNRETRRIDAERASLESRVQTQYTWLFQERAKAMSEIYQALIEASDAYEDFGKSWGRLPGDTKGPKDKWIDARNAGAVFTESFRKHRLLFPQKVADALAMINRRYVAIFNAYHRELYLAEGDEHKALLNMMQKGEPDLSTADEAIALVEREFRRLYGSSEDEAVSVT